MFYVRGFYKIKRIIKCIQYKDVLKKNLLSRSVKGTIILSPEGINGTIAGGKKDVNYCIEFIKNKFSITSFDSHNTSICKFSPFYRAKVKVKKEVVPIGLKLNVIEKKKNRYIDPDQWNRLIIDKSITLIDLRKSFEFKVGKGEVWNDNNW